MFEGVKVVEVVGFLAELDAGVASAELFNQEAVVLLHDLPNQLSWNGRHFFLPLYTPTHCQTQPKQISAAI